MIWGSHSSTADDSNQAVSDAALLGLGKELLQRKVHHTFYALYASSTSIVVSAIIKQREVTSSQPLISPSTVANNSCSYGSTRSTSQPTLYMAEQMGARSSTGGKLTWRVNLRNMVRCTWNLLRCRISTAGGVFTKSCFVELVHTILPSLPVQVNISPLIKRSNLMQQYADIYLLQSHSTCFGRHGTHHQEY